MIHDSETIKLSLKKERRKEYERCLMLIEKYAMPSGWKAVAINALRSHPPQ